VSYKVTHYKHIIIFGNTVVHIEYVVILLVVLIQFIITIGILLKITFALGAITL